MNDYISRDAVMRLHPKNVKVVGLTAYVDAEELMELVSGIPAADVEPVRHSYWESYETSQYMGTDEFGEPKWRPGRFYICHNRKCRRKTVVKSDYCPNCGAKMKGDESNDD